MSAAHTPVTAGGPSQAAAPGFILEPGTPEIEGPDDETTLEAEDRKGRVAGKMKPTPTVSLHRKKKK